MSRMKLCIIVVFLSEQILVDSYVNVDSSTFSTHSTDN